MGVVLSNGFCELTQNEMEIVEGGMAPAALYALGFVFGCSPLTICVAAGVGVVALGAGIYCGVKGLG